MVIMIIVFTICARKMCQEYLFRPDCGLDSPAGSHSGFSYWSNLPAIWIFIFIFLYVDS